MIYLLYILVILFFLVCLYQLNRIRSEELKKQSSKYWISVVMGLFGWPIVKLLDRILLDFGLQENQVFYLSLVILLIMALTIKWIYNIQGKNAGGLNGQ